MTEYGLQIRNSNAQIVIEDKASLGLKIGDGSSVVNACSGYKLDFSAINNTKNVDAVWNSNNWVCPYFECNTKGESWSWNRFWLNFEAELHTNIISVGVGNEIPITDTYGIYVLDSKGIQILNSQNKMLKLVAQFSTVVSISQQTLTTSQGKWLWHASIDISGLDWTGSKKWVSITPIRFKQIYEKSTSFLFSNTIFYMDATTLYMGDYLQVVVDGTSFIVEAENFIVSVMLFSEGN